MSRSVPASTKIKAAVRFLLNAVITLACLLCASGCGEIPVTGPAPGETLTVTLSANTTVAFVWIQPGIFVMGSSDFEEGRFADEGPQHQVEISRGFYLGKYEVTQAQWEAVMGNQPWARTAPAEGPRDYVVEHPDHPCGVYLVAPCTGFYSKAERRRRGFTLPAAHGGGVGICGQSRDDNALVVWRR